MGKKPSGAGKAVAVRKAADGDITHVKFENRERMTPLKQAIEMTKAGLTEGVQVNRTGQGREYLQDKPDGSTADNLDNLPEK